MSDQTQEVVNEANAVDEKDLMAEIEKLKSTNERLLAESNKYKTRKSEVEDIKQQLEDYKKKELESGGNWEEMLELERQKRAELQQELEMRDKKLMASNIYNAVSKHAKDAHSIDDLLEKKAYVNMLEIDEDSLSPTEESVKLFVDSLKKDKTYLFKGHEVPSMSDTKPTVEKPKPKSIKQLSQKEREDKMKELISSLGHNR